MELIQKQVHYTQEGKRTFDQFYLDEDLNVPDTKDDVKQIIQGTASAMVEEIRLTENYLRISGKLYYQILYMTDSAEPQPAALEGKLPFEEMVYMDSGEMTEYFIQNIRVEFTSTLVHSRKLSIRAMVEMEIGREKLEDILAHTEKNGVWPVTEPQQRGFCAHPAGGLKCSGAD